MTDNWARNNQERLGLQTRNSRSLFGSIGRDNTIINTQADFIPKDANGGTIKIKGEDACWKGLNDVNMQFWAYCYCSPLASVIDRLAECDINGELEILKTDESEDYSKSPAAKRILSLLRQPNPFQTWEDFRGQQLVFKKAFGYCPVLAMDIAGFDKSYVKYLWNMNPYFCKPRINQERELFSEKPLVFEWVINIFGKTYTIPQDKVFMIKDGYMPNANDQALLPLSKVAGLDWAVSNICAAMEADNVLLRKKGPLGFISHDPKPDNVSGYTPMFKEDVDEIQQNLNQYGLSWSEFQYVVSKIGIKWNPMSFNVKDLATKETIRQAIDMICDRYAYPAELMSGKNATYENRSSAEKFLYNSNVIPSSIRDMRVYNNFFGFIDVFKIRSDFNELPMLQEDIVQAGQSEQYRTNAYLIQFQNSVITLNKYRSLLGIDTVDGDNIYYKEATAKYGQAITQQNQGAAA